MDNVLVTGGCGYIGSHTVLTLLEKGHNVSILDSHHNSNPIVIKKLKEIIYKFDDNLLRNLNYFNVDLRNHVDLEKIFLRAKDNNQKIDSVIHFAGLKAVNESVINPLLYWDFNIGGTINLLKVMKKYLCKDLIFSSSATIYDNSYKNLIDENCPIRPTNPYGKTKANIESLLKDIFKSEMGEWRIINLRYFNPIGAHKSGNLGECPNGLPNNIFPLILKVASKKLKVLNVYGDDWNTRDGTCIRDYVHILDLAEGHVEALKYLKNNDSQFLNLNIGTGVGTTVLELINTFMKVNNIELPFVYSSRREGDKECVVADNTKILNTLDWKPKRDLEDMCIDGWKWQTLNPDGYVD